MTVKTQEIRFHSTALEVIEKDIPRKVNQENPGKLTCSVNGFRLHTMQQLFLKEAPGTFCLDGNRYSAVIEAIAAPPSVLDADVPQQGEKPFEVTLKITAFLNSDCEEKDNNSGIPL